MTTLDVDYDSSSPARVVNERVYVAVGREFEESKLTLQWALDCFGVDFRILYVHSPTKSNPSGKNSSFVIIDIDLMVHVYSIKSLAIQSSVRI